MHRRLAPGAWRRLARVTTGKDLLHLSSLWLKVGLGTQWHMYHKGQHEGMGRCYLVSLAWEKDRIGWGSWALLECMEVWAGRFKWREVRDSPSSSLWELSVWMWGPECYQGQRAPGPVGSRARGQHDSAPTSPATAVGRGPGTLVWEAGAVVWQLWPHMQSRGKAEAGLHLGTH